MHKVALVEHVVTVEVKILYWLLFSRVFALIIKINILD